MPNLDRTFCASPGCVNACGRKITDAQRAVAHADGRLLSWAYFCGEPEREEG